MPECNQEADSFRFPPTRWTLVAHAQAPEPEAGLDAMNELLTAYSPVLRGYLRLVMRLRPEQAEDMVQDFVTRRILEGRLLQRADRTRGRFRSFLLKCFLNFVRSELRKEKAAKRGPPPSQMLNLDDHAQDIADPCQERRAFDALWARQVLGAALERMQKDCEEKGRQDVWTVFEQRVLNPIFSDNPPRPYEELVTALGLKSPLQASNLLITAKRGFQRALEAVVRETVANETDIRAEIAALKRALGGVTG